MITFDYRQNENTEYCSLTFEPSNETHRGKAEIEFFQNIKNLILTASLIAEERTYSLTKVVCKWLENPSIGFMINFMDKYVKKSIDPTLLNCEIKKGRYVMLKTRERIENPEELGMIPSFFAAEQNFTLKYFFKMRVKKQIVSLLNVSETFKIEL